MLRQNGSRIACHGAAAWWLALWVVAIVATGCERQSPRTALTSVQPEAQIEVSCTLLFQGRGSDVAETFRVSRDASVFDVLAELGRRQNLEIESRGAGSTLFVTAIGGVRNEQGAGDNWVYLVNDQLGDTSAGVRLVAAGDRVIWRFGSYP